MPVRAATVGAALAAAGALAGLQAVLLGQGVQLTEPASVRGTDARLVGYRLDGEGAGDGPAFTLELAFDGRPPARAPAVRLLPVAGVARAGPVVAPPASTVLAREERWLRLRVVPREPPGVFKLRVGSSRPFGAVVL